MMFRRILFIALIGVTSSLYAQSTGDAESRAELAREQASKFTGSPSLATAAGSTTTNKDIVSQFIAALETLSQSNGQAITFDWKLPSIFEKHVAKAQAVLQKPDLSKVVADKLKTNAEALTQLRSELSYTDDVLLSVSVSPMKKEAQERAAAAFATFAAPIYIATQNNVVAANAAALSNLQIAGKGIANPIQAAHATAAVAALQQQAILQQTVDEETRRQFVRMIGPSASAYALATANEAKFNFDASYHSRRDTIGPNEWSLKASYEVGTGSTVESTLKKRRSICVNEYQTMNVTPTCVGDIHGAVIQVAQDPAVKKQTRFSASLAFHQLASLDVIDARYSLNEHSKSSRSLVWKVASGRDIYGPEPEGESKLRGRLEASVAYDDVQGDTKVMDRRDRLVGTVTYTQIITDKLQIPISLVYANHADYLTNVDRKLNAHFGLLYKIPPKK